MNTDSTSDNTASASSTPANANGITPMPGEGIIINLDKFERLRPDRGCPDFWHPQHQNILVQKLAPFLPRIIDSGDSATATIIENSHELLGNSTAATPNFSNVPASQVNKLHNVLHQFLEESAKLPADAPTAKLSLPDPAKAPELYRLYGTGKNKRLAIIWGICKLDANGNEDTSTVATIQQLQHLLPPPRKETAFTRFMDYVMETVAKLKVLSQAFWRLPNKIKWSILGGVAVAITALMFMCATPVEDYEIQTIREPELLNGEYVLRFNVVTNKAGKEPKEVSINDSNISMDKKFLRLSFKKLPNSVKVKAIEHDGTEKEWIMNYTNN